MKNTLRLAITLSALSAAVASQAVLDLQITLPASKTIASGGTLSGSVVGANGKVSLTGTGFTYGGGTFAFTSSFLSYIASNTGGDYTGTLATATNLSTSTTAFGSLSVSDTVSSDSENFAVNPVPEPSAFAALGLGAAAFLRRRRKA